MKFVSRNANLRIILKQGIPADALGHPTVPALSVKFEDGMVEVHNEEVIELLMQPEKGYGVDYIISDVGAADPYSREGSEPEHDIMNIENGRVAKNVNPRQAVSLTPEMKKAVEKMAFEYAKEIAKEMVINLVKEQKNAVKEGKNTEDSTEESLTEEDNVSLEGTAPVFNGEDFKDEDSKMPPPNKPTKTKSSGKK